MSQATTEISTVDEMGSRDLSTDNGNATVAKKLAYGVGALANGISVAIIGFFIFKYMIFQLGITTQGYAIIQVVTQVTNAISDPLIGILSDKTRTRFGRRRPFLFISSIMMPLFYVLLFTDFGIKNDVINLLFYMFLFVMFYTAQTIFNVPHMSLLVDMDDKETVRNSFAAYSSAFFALGNLIGPISLLFLIDEPKHKDVNRVYTLHALGMGVIMFLTILTVSLGVRERRDIPVEKKTLKEIFRDYVSIMKYKSYRNLTLVYISSQIAVQTLQFNLQIYIQQVLVDDEALKYIMPISLLASIICILPLVILIKKIGKRMTYFIGMALFLPVFFTILVGVPKENNRAIFAILGILAGIGTGTAFYISSAMLPDVIVEDYLITGKNREGAFYSFYVFLQKIAISLSHALTSKIIDWAGGIDTEVDLQTITVRNAIQYSISCIPIVFIFLSFLWIYRYPLTKEKVEENQKAYLILKSKSLKNLLYCLSHRIYEIDSFIEIKIL